MKKLLDYGVIKNPEPEIIRGKMLFGPAEIATYRILK